MSSRLIPVVANDRFSFFLKAEYHIIYHILYIHVIYIYHIFFIHTSIEGHTWVVSVLDYCEQCYNVHGNADTSLRY